MSSVATYRMLCTASALAATPEGWAAATLGDGAVSLLPDDGGLEAIDAAARVLRTVEVSVLARAQDAGAREEAVIGFAGSLALIWVAPTFSRRAREWASARGPMTLLVQAAGELPPAELGRIERFVTLLARQAD